ncbi:hypothetical protein B4589_003730 [Halolamina sp. CBA1230]|uniref:hypothetical protein n=1 Tax=Halolamina sp. CBA1230 TaxID=1853690 RepID=UPI0009A192DB|nr:hypothetical protein [Halolamina sp. CBA1230]QKY19527.1 hypothetical protein B4589_003730 [Halolamina sp. CBA1230]
MQPVPAHAFASEFRALPAGDRVGFVADLWAARGWETSVEDDVVVAERDDERRRIRVTDPGRFGTPDLSGVDTLVAARDRDAVQSAAAEAGVRYVPPEKLRDLLLYGVERDAAAALYEEWFDQPLERTVVDEADEETALDTVRGRIPAVVGQQRALVGLLLVALVGVALAGPTVPGIGGPDREPITVGDVTPAEESGGAIGARSPTPTDGPELLPGVTRAGVVDPAALVSAHKAAVRNRSRVRSVVITGPPNASVTAGAVRQNLTTRIVNASHYRHRTVSQLSKDAENGSMARLGVYADGEAVFQRTVFNETRYARFPPSQRPGTLYDDLTSYLYRYVVSDDSTVHCVGENASGCRTYRIAVDGDPPTVLQGDIADYEAVANVSDRGVIRRIRASYTLPDRDDDGEREPVRFALDYRFETVELSPPAWLPEARNETAPVTTPTPANASENGTATSRATSTATETPS